MIKLIVSDVDGTLIDKKYQIPELNMRALQDCKREGIRIVLATGKLIYSLIPIIKPLGLTMPQITAGGATLIDLNLKVHRAIKLNPDLFSEIIDYIKSNGYSPLVSLQDNIMYYDQFTPVVDYIKQTGENLQQTSNLDSDNFKNNAIAISVLHQQEEFGNKLVEKFSNGGVMITRPWKTYVNILPARASKGRALKEIIKHLDLRQEEVAVFGDNLNDLSMFDTAGLKIAVKNAHQQLTDTADIITGSNNEAGVGKAIYNHILEGGP
ncbi:MAG: Cof-type HAD-IIB family hydrolase [Actinomycetia bacterium]|nr:Cof-type HAD-IIB family hydrolase [Actinomycetes bacterium]